MSYVEQRADFGLGNFINITPTIRALYERDGRIPILFRTEYVKECYRDCPYIRIINEPDGERLFGSELINQTIPDYLHVMHTILGEEVECKGFIDTPEPTMSGYGVIMNGSGSDIQGYCDKKVIDSEVWNYVIAKSTVPVYFTGSESDMLRNMRVNASNLIINDIRASLSLINGADWVISNDTGLAHAAGVMNKRLLTLFKNTAFPKNMNMGKKSSYAFGDYINSIDNFL